MAAARQLEEPPAMTLETTAQTAAEPEQPNLAAQQAYLAYERTLMAWIRTATSMITFGFALHKFYFYVHQEKPPTPSEEVFGGRTFGLLMMGIGVFALAAATWQHHARIRVLHGQYGQAPASLSLVLAGLIAGLGILGFAAAIF